MSRIDRALMRLVSQETSLTNAAEATANLLKRRREQEEVDAYLGALPSSSESPSKRLSYSIEAETR